MSPLNRQDIKETSHHKKGLEIPANSVQVTRLCEKIYTSNNNYIENKQYYMECVKFWE